MKSGERLDFLSLGDRFQTERRNPKTILGLTSLSGFSDVVSSGGYVYYAPVFYLSNYFRVNLETKSVDEFPMYSATGPGLVFGLKNLTDLPEDLSNQKGMSYLQVDNIGNLHILSGGDWNGSEYVNGRSIRVISSDGQLLKTISLDRSFKLILWLKDKDYYLGLDEEDQLVYKISID